MMLVPIEIGDPGGESPISIGTSEVCLAWQQSITWLTHGCPSLSESQPVWLWFHKR